MICWSVLASVFVVFVHTFLHGCCSPITILVLSRFIDVSRYFSRDSYRDTLCMNRGMSHDNIHCLHRGISHDNIHCSLKPRCTNWSASVNRDHFVTRVQLQLQSKAGSRAFARKRHNLHCDAQVGAENKSTWSLKINAHDGILSFRTSRIIITRCVPENAYFRS